VIVAK